MHKKLLFIVSFLVSLYKYVISTVTFTKHVYFKYLVEQSTLKHS